jgi:hypothetical protein
MKKTLLMAGALLALTAGIASAQGGINLSWNDCGTFGTLQKNFACTSNSGANVMYASVMVGAPIPNLNGQASVLDMQTNQAALSNWWQFNTGGCRFNSTSFLSVDYNFVAGPFNCTDIWGGGASGGINYAPGFSGPNRARIRTVGAIIGTTSMADATEYYIQKITFTNARSTGAGACAGCSDGVCIVFNSILLTQPAGQGDFTVSNTLDRNWVQFQGGAANVTGGCPQATPTQNRTWGSVKSLYR